MPLEFIRTSLHPEAQGAAVIPRFQVCEQLVENQLARGLSHAGELSFPHVQRVRANVQQVRVPGGEYLFEVRRLADHAAGEDLLPYGRAPAFNKMLAFSSLETLRKLRCEGPCSHTTVTIIVEASGLGYHCTLDRPHVTQRAPLLKWSDTQKITFLRRRGAKSKPNRVYTKSNSKVFLRQNESVQAQLYDRHEFVDVGAEFAALQHLDSLRFLADGGYGLAPALRALTTLTNPMDYAQNLRGALLDFYGDVSSEEHEESEENPWRCNLEKVLFGEPGASTVDRKHLARAGILCNRIDGNIVGIETLIKLHDSRQDLAHSIAQRYEAPTGVVAAHWRRILAPRVAELSRQVTLEGQAKMIIDDLEWRCRATSVIWRTFSAYVRLWHHQTGSWKESRYTELTDRLRQRLGESNVALFGQDGIQRKAPTTTRLFAECDLTVELSALAPGQKPKNARAAATARRFMTALTFLREEFLAEYRLPEAFDELLESVFLKATVPVEIPVPLNESTGLAQESATRDVDSREFRAD